MPLRLLRGYRRSALVITLGWFALVVAVWTITLERVSYERAETVEDVVAQNANLSLAFEQQTTGTFQSVDQALLYLRYEYKQHGAALDLRAMLGLFDPEVYLYAGVIDAHGRLIMGGNSAAPVDLSERDYFAFHRDNPADVMKISRPVKSRITGQFSVQFTRRIVGSEGRFAGVVLVGVSPAYMAEFSRRVELGPDDVVQLAGLDGISLVRRVGENTSFGGDLRNSTLQLHAASQPAGHFVSTSRVDGIARYISYRTLSRYPFVVAVGKTVDNSMAEFRRRERSYYAAAATATLLSALFALGLWLAVTRQRKALLEKQRSEASYRATFEQAPVGISHADVTGKFLAVNATLCRMLGYSQQELLERSWPAVTHPEDLKRSLDLIAKLSSKAATAVPELEKRYVRKDGSILWGIANLAIVRDDSGAAGYFVTMLRDVTARKRAEEDLRQSEQRLSGVLNSQETFICRVDLEGRLTYMNETFARAYGAKLGDLSWSHVHPDDMERARVELPKVHEPPYHCTLEVRNRIHGEWRWVHWQNSLIRDASGKVAELQGVGFDVHERRRAEDAFHESEQRFRAVVEQSIAAVYVIQDGQIVYGNPRTREIFGYGPAEPINQDPLAHIVPDERARIAQLIERGLREESEMAYSVAALRKDGTPFTLGVHSKRASFDGRPAIIAVAQDITERARAEEEIKRYIGRLEQAMKSTINVVATIGELRDPYTHGHERRVGEIAAAIATEMGLEENRVEGIRIAGYLHDVGKISVPAEILAKPTRLTKAEFELVKEHAQTSYEILKGVEFPWPVAQTARQHHERLDGSGYPQGLRGDEIILEARILAVADTVEAMSSHRPYRPGLGIDAALAEIEKSRGKLYDPGAVDACLRLFREKHYRLAA